MSNFQIPKHSAMVNDRRTSFSLETPFHERLVDMAKRRGVTMNALVSEIDANAGTQNLSSAIRLAILRDLQDQIAALKTQTEKAA